MFYVMITNLIVTFVITYTCRICVHKMSGIESHKKKSSKLDGEGNGNYDDLLLLVSNINQLFFKMSKGIASYFFFQWVTSDGNELLLKSNSPSPNYSLEIKFDTESE